MTKVINLWAGPGAGKSTTAAALFALAKQEGLKAELVTEYAKELTYDRAAMSDQFHILAEQNRRLRRLVGQVDYIITDAPLPLALIYADPEWQTVWFRNATMGLFNSYENRNFRIIRHKPYARYGRTQTEEQARFLDTQVWALLDSHDIQHASFLGDATAPSKILEAIR